MVPNKGERERERERERARERQREREWVRRERETERTETDRDIEEGEVGREGVREREKDLSCFHQYNSMLMDFTSA